jgi:hypothetical protein
MEIRDAVPDSARGDQAKSISDLCRAEHLNNPVIVALWLLKPGNSHVVAIEDGSILALASVTDAGEITLNHMSPDARFGGVSRALLVAVETRAQKRGKEPGPSAATMLQGSRNEVQYFTVFRRYRTATVNSEFISVVAVLGQRGNFAFSGSSTITH